MTSAAPAASRTWNLWAYLSLLLRRWRTVAAGILAGGAVAVAFALILPASYTTEVKFAPAESSRLSGLGSLGGFASSMSGLGGVLGADQQSSAYFYQTLAQSTEILREVILTRYPVTGDSAQTLLQIDGVTGKTPNQQLNKEIKALGKRLVVDVDRDANVVTLKVEAGTPALSAAIATAFLGAINRFNVQTRNSSAHARRVFLDGRIGELGDQLRAAEDTLKAFLTVNRSYENSPTLAFEYARLRRRVDAYQDLYVTVRREGEMASIQEVSDVPVISIIQPPLPPTEKSKPKRRLLAVAGVGLGGLIAYAIVLLRLYFEGLAPSERQAMLDVRESWAVFRHEFGSLFHRT